MQNFKLLKHLEVCKNYLEYFSKRNRFHITAIARDSSHEITALFLFSIFSLYAIFFTLFKRLEVCENYNSKDRNITMQVETILHNCILDSGRYGTLLTLRALRWTINWRLLIMTHTDDNIKVNSTNSLPLLTSIMKIRGQLFVKSKNDCGCSCNESATFAICRCLHLIPRICNK